MLSFYREEVLEEDLRTRRFAPDEDIRLPGSSRHALSCQAGHLPFERYLGSRELRSNFPTPSPSAPLTAAN
jgi:hypothetical protein